MFNALLEKFFGKKSQRDVKRLEPLLAQVKETRVRYRDLDDDALRGVTRQLQERLAAGETTDDVLPEAYGLCWEACRRLAERKASWPVWDREVVWDMVPYDVQIIGGIVLHQGRIAEMATGEGKTLVAVMPMFLNALTGRGAHLVTVNDYLARRDAEWMGGVYRFLGLSVGYIINSMTPDQRREAYNSDITYGTNNEFGFDYLRDNMAVRKEQLVQREFHYAIVDEVDSVLIDEARTPLIISGAVDKSTHRFEELKPRVEKLVQRQNRMINDWVADVERRFRDAAEDGPQVDLDDEAALALLRVSRGAPKNKRFRRLCQFPGVLDRIAKTEEAFMRDKAMWEADEPLLYVVEEKHNSSDFTEKGRALLSEDEADFFVLPDLAEEVGRIQEAEDLTAEQKADAIGAVERQYAVKNEQISNVDQLLKAYTLFAKDDEYVVLEGKIQIVDEFTGRLMPGRRFSEGLHQALEAKEGVKVEKETQTLATVTLQNFFRMYDKLAGMTGTAVTEEAEFGQIYDLDVVEIPTNEPIRRKDHDDVVYRSKKEKFAAIADEVARLHEKGLPVLVGTTTVEVSEMLSRVLKRRGINHNVLNAKHHKSEAEIVAEAGRKGAVTIATNMAGRGTDIKVDIRGLTGLPADAPIDKSAAEVDGEPAGLHIIGTERHESRRIDRQLRGRSGRQGDPGSSIFFLSLEDDLMRLFNSEQLIKIMDRMGVQEGEVITHSMVTKAIERAAQRVEGHNFSIRKHLIEYDDVVNKQREVIYGQRREILMGEDVSDALKDHMLSYVDGLLEQCVGRDQANDFWDWDTLAREFQTVILTPLPVDEDEKLTIGEQALQERLHEAAQQRYADKERRLSPEITRQLERFVLLQTIDEFWKDHLNELVLLRSGISLRSYGQKDPLVEYKRESFNMFETLMGNIERESVRLFFRAELAVSQPAPPPVPEPSQLQARHDEVGYLDGAAAPEQVSAPQRAVPDAGAPQPVTREEPKVGRNDPCPCGSGKKYKRCCGTPE
ncbi:MAG TPA: preprotein translocase subunit SecA [Candidatus Krumholzibacteria bacterium]|nr:preprotein translocase subunit SecA [Candidatus Krumholzibacteria bacterium]HRX50948.1 preprotein translocase subunit SecA [Candidatus Krumholzibacteria bacterium]